MPLICYIRHHFSPPAERMIDYCNDIIDDYLQKGLTLTLRQIYYQLVAHDRFPDDKRWAWQNNRWVHDANGTKNADPNYKWLGDIVSDARLAGRIDWSAIEDRGRFLRSLTHWKSPEDIVAACAQQFRLDRWTGQEFRVEVLVEKDALVGIVEAACNPLDTAYFSCRGYNSQTAMWELAQRLIRYRDDGQIPVLLHLGDHDPSGIDMTRDIQDRLNCFLTHHGHPKVELHRIALNMDQVKQYNPPPNPAKLTDSRCQAYITKHGNESWELDALPPEALVELITTEVSGYFDEARYQPVAQQQEHHRASLRSVAEHWERALRAANR